MYQRILVPVDGSSTSGHALQEACKFARQLGAQLELLYVMDDIRLMNADSYINYAEMTEALKSNGNRVLAQAHAEARQAGIEAEVKLLEASGSRIASIIVEEARSWPADLIVIGTHGRSGFSRVVFGSVAEGVVRTAPIPVLLIRGA